MMSQCYPRFSTQWATDPKMQISYVAVRKWARQNTPGVILGVYTEDEMGGAEPVRHMGEVELAERELLKPAKNDDPTVVAAFAEADKGRESFLAWWGTVPKPQRLALHARLPDFEHRCKLADDKRTIDSENKATPKAKAAAETATGEAAATPAAATGAPVFTFDDVNSRMQNARKNNDIDALNMAADLIGQVTDDAGRKVLESTYETMIGEMS
jgi:hypothetical protein